MTTVRLTIARLTSIARSGGIATALMGCAASQASGAGGSIPSRVQYATIADDVFLPECPPRSGNPDFSHIGHRFAMAFSISEQPPRNQRRLQSISMRVLEPETSTRRPAFRRDLGRPGHTSQRSLCPTPA